MSIDDLSEKTLYDYSNTIFTIAQLIESHIKVGKIKLVSDCNWLQVLSFTKQFLACNIISKIPELRGIIVQNIRSLYSLGDIELRIDMDSEICYYYTEYNFDNLCIEFQNGNTNILPLFRNIQIIDFENMCDQFGIDCDKNVDLHEIFKKSIKELYMSRY